ncbi:cell division protein ZapA [Comamonas sp. 4034]|uniref:cell division protein ZapA n=1 Tax=Comamonas sp. 4034 TaxID=3156455 RepID=UPI003D1A486A
MKQLEVHIMQQSYMLGCPEGQEERLMAAVKQVDEAMCGIRDAGKIRGRERIAVLAALNMAFDLLDLKTQNTELNQEAEQARTQVAQLEQAEPATAQASLDWEEPRLQSIMQRLDAATGQPATGNATQTV